MKQLLLLLSISLITIHPLLAHTPAGAGGRIESISLQASGLTCSMCSRAIYKSLLKVSSVKKVEEDIKNSTYTIFFKDQAKVILDDLKRAVKNAGFSVAAIEVNARFDHTEIAAGAPLRVDDLTFTLTGPLPPAIEGRQRLVLQGKDLQPSGSDGEKIYHATLKK